MRPPLNPVLGLAYAGAMLEVVLENLGRQSRTHVLALSLSLSLRFFLSLLLSFDGTDYFAATDHFSGRQSGNLWRQHQADFQLCVGLQHFLCLEEQSRAADIFCGPRPPALFA